jgi:hypothetical protein
VGSDFCIRHRAGPAGLVAGRADSAIGRDTSKVAVHSRQRYS